MTKNIGAQLRRGVRAWINSFRSMLKNEAPSTAAAISYFSLFALFPAILVLIALANVFLGWIDLHERVLQTILALFPGSRSFLAANLAEITAPSAHLIAACLLILLWSSTWVFFFVENAFNRAWGVPRHRTFWQSRLRSFALLIITGVLLLTSTGISGLVRTLRAAASERMPAELSQDQIINWFWSSLLVATGFLVAILVFFLIYKLMPDRKVLWSEAMSGALVAAVLWECASYFFARMVPYFNYQRIYGRMGAIIALLVWVYTSSLITLFGASFSAELHRPDLEQGTLFSDPNLSRSPSASAAAGRKIRAFSRRR